MTDFTKAPKEFGKEVILTEAQALLKMSENMPPQFDEAIELILHQKGRIILSGMGKSGHIARKIASTFASTGTPSFFVHPGEASHGDLGMITKDDCVVLLSNSGETRELSDIIAHCRRFFIPMIAITGPKKSTISQAADIALKITDAPEACAVGMAPTTSTTLTIALGDALAVTAMRLRGFDRDSFLNFHPGGKLGAQLLRVRDMMHSGDALPLVCSHMPMSDTLLIMTEKGFGTVAVLDEQTLYGVITDGDLRRNMDGLMNKCAGEVATRNPRTILSDSFASDALAEMQDHKINSLFVIGDEKKLVGLIHIHDCLRIGLL